MVDQAQAGQGANARMCQPWPMSANLDLVRSI
jgi:hypothetical protein